jgi:hypothetical protein
VRVVQEAVDWDGFRDERMDVGKVAQNEARADKICFNIHNLFTLEG